MSNLDAGGPATGCRLEVDEEPPGSPLNLFACPSTSQALRPHWPHVFAGREYLVHSARIPRPPRSTPQTRAFRRAFYRDVADKEWNDWRWQARNRIRTLGQLEQMLGLSDEEREALLASGAMLPFGITPYYMSLLARDDPLQPLRRTVVPTDNESDPLARRGRRSAGRGARQPGARPGPSLSGPRAAPGPGFLLDLLPLLHPLAGGRARRDRPQPGRLEKALDYIRRTPEIRDVLLSGGDPLCLSDERLDWLLGAAAGDPARRVHPHRHEDARRAAAAHHPRAVPRCSASTIPCG